MKFGKTLIYKTANYFSKIYNYAIALTRKESGSVTMGFALSLMNYAFAFFMIMIMMVFIRGSMGIAIRGDFGLYILTGVGLYLLHNKIIQELSTPGKDKGMIPVLAVGPGIMISGSILHTFYMQTMIVLLFLAGCWAYYGGIHIDQPVKAIWIYLLCGAWSIAFGMCIYSVVPVAPSILGKVVQIYRRLGVITSGKMVPGNMMRGTFHGMFAWNPLFHCIDQIRGAVFLNYTPFNSSLHYPIMATVFAGSIGCILYLALRRFR